MADTNVSIAFSADTSGLEAGAARAKAALSQIGTTAADSSRMGTQLFKTMEQASDQMVLGILRGTQTWQQSLQRLFTSILSSFISTLVINPALEWIRKETIMTAATEEGNAARNVSSQASSGLSKALLAQQAVDTLSIEAAEAYGGVFAFLAPYMGPAAAGPAAAAEAQVLGQMSLIPLEVGAWNIPSDMPAYLHAGEMVVPRDFASGLRDGALSGGGDSYAITINAIDTQTGAQFLKNNAALIAQSLSGQARHFNRNVPVWKS